MLLTEQVLLTIHQRKLLKTGDRVLVAVSGGADSVALLHALNSLKRKLEIKVLVAHLDHGMRGKESAEDARFVKRLAKKFKLKIVIGGVSQKIKSEDEARTVRYEFLENTARILKANKIALAHNANDQVETMLMRIMRGTGLKGLTGMPYQRSSGGFKIIRPLLDVERAGVMEYLKSKKLKFRYDSSNSSLKFFRNRIRHKLIPYLEKIYSPEIKKLVLQLKDSLSADYELINKLGKAAFNKVARVERGQVVLSRKKFNSLDLALKREVIRRVIRKLRGSLVNVEFRHVAAAIKAIDQRRQEELPGSLRVNARYERIIFYDIMAEGAKFTITLSKLSRVPKLKSKKANIEYLDNSKLKLPLLVRTRQDGDIFKPLGMKKSFKLKEFFINQKVPQMERDSIPLLISGRKICYVAGLRIGEDFKVTGKTREVLKIEAKKY